MMHCDIKPDNILIHNRTFKIADFGLTRFKESDETSKTTWYLGTALYSPPEKEGTMGRGRDVWALGCVFLEIAFMIRYAFQEAMFFPDPSITNIIDDFKMRRERACEEAGREKTAIYHKTMDAVHINMSTFNTMRPGLRKLITVEGMFPVIRKMLDMDQARRITALKVVRSLESHYLKLQGDTQLQCNIICQDNPGGPPVDWGGDWNGPHLNMSSTNVPAGGPFPQPSPRQNLPASFGKTEATERLKNIGLYGKKRSSSPEERGSNKRRWDGPPYY
jgi:serine/threonine protein kinase